MKFGVSFLNYEDETEFDATLKYCLLVVCLQLNYITQNDMQTMILDDIINKVLSYMLSEVIFV